MADFRAHIRELTVLPVVFIDCQPVYEKDRFAMSLGLKPVVAHFPWSGLDRGKLESAYAIAWHENGFARIEYAVALDGMEENEVCRLAVERLAKWLVPPDDRVREVAPTAGDPAQSHREPTFKPLPFSREEQESLRFTEIEEVSRENEKA